MRAPGRSVVLALVPLGTIAGHVLGYLMAGEDAVLHGPHGHLRPAAWIAAGLTAAALASVAVARTGRRRPLPSLWPVVAAQVALFGLLEVIEHLQAGHGALSIAADPSFRWGVVAQLVSAALLVKATRLARDSGERVRTLLSRLRRAWAKAACRRRWFPARAVPVRRAGVSAVSERGPPVRSALA